MLTSVVAVPVAMQTVREKAEAAQRNVSLNKRGIDMAAKGDTTLDDPRDYTMVLSLAQLQHIVKTVNAPS